MTEAFENWSGSLRFDAAERVVADSEADVVATVERALETDTTIRPVGAGHSSVPLVATDQVLLSVDGMTGMTDRAPGGLATLLPGTSLQDVGEELAGVGLTLANLGDVDYQTIAGALATGTHGTGVTLGNLSTMLVGGRLVTGEGDVVELGTADDGTDGGSDDDLLRAAQVSLGSLGVLTSVVLQVVPAHDLHRINWCCHIDWVLEHLDELVAQNRHVDFYWYPRSDLAQVRVMNEPGQGDVLMPDDAEVRVDEVGPSSEIIPNARDLRFDEMEYMLPIESGIECFEAVRRRIKARHRQNVAWRVLVRTIAADDAMLSNCNGRTTMSIALLQNDVLPHEQYFADVEPIFWDFDGRPHWGKKHSMTATGLRDHFPEWEAFHHIRRRLDPHGVFMSPYLRQLFEEPG